MPHQEVIDPLAGFVVGDGAQFDGALWDVQMHRFGRGTVHISLSLLVIPLTY
jgi:hypothetical protein